MVPVLLALAAALLYALASVLQQRAAAAEPAEHSLRPGLLGRLVCRPLWIAGVGADVVAFGCQFAALALGTLVVVQPLLTLGILFALPIAARLEGLRVRRVDLAWAGVLCAGLAVFLGFSDPAAGRASTGSAAWVTLLAAGGVVAAALAAAGHRRRGSARAVLLSAATGVIYGVAAALLKTTGYLLSIGVGHAFAHWQPYVLVVVGAAGMLVGQSAFQAGSLEASLPAMSVIDPVVSVLVGALAFGESMAVSPGALAAELAGVALTVAGVLALSRSPAIRALH